MKTDNPNQQMEMPLDGVSANHWDWVHRLIKDVEDQEQREHLIGLWAQWKMASRQFRHVEFSVMRKGRPAAADLAFHRSCLSGLLSIGDFLLMGISGITNQEECKKLGFDRNDAAAALVALRHNWEEWHGFTHPERMAEIEKRIASLNGQSEAH